VGEGNATVKRAEPTRYQADWGGTGRAGAAGSLTFVSERGAADADLVRRLAAGGRAVVPIRNARGLTRADLVHNRATAAIEIDPVDGRVTLAGRPLASEAVTEVPLNRRYWLR
jgi:urease subunit alpha